MIISETIIEFQVWECCSLYVINAPRDINLYLQKDETVSYEKPMELISGGDIKCDDPEWRYEDTLGHWGQLR